jgi:hypothetical protein
MSLRNRHRFSLAVVTAAVVMSATATRASLVQIPPSGSPPSASFDSGALQRVAPSATPPTLLQGLQGYTLVAGKTSALRVYLDDPAIYGATHELLVVLVRPDGGIATLSWSGDEIRAVLPRANAPIVPASLVVRIPGTAIDLVGRYRIEIFLRNQDGQVLYDAAIGAIDALATKDVRVAVDRIWSGFPTKPGEYQAAIDGLDLMSSIWPVRDGIAEFDLSDTAGIRYMLNDNPQQFDAHLGPFFDSAHFRAPGLDFADLGIAYRFPNDGEGSGANASHIHNGLRFSVVVWGAPLGWTYSHESAHIQGLVPPESPHYDGGVHSGDQFIDVADAALGYDPRRHRPWSDTMFDIMFYAGSGNEDSYGLSSWDWEFIRQSLLSLPSTGPTGPVFDWTVLGGSNSFIATAANVDGRREVFALAGGTLNGRSQSAPGGSWNPWAPLSGSGNQGPVEAIRMGDGRLAVFMRAADQSVLHATQTTPGGTWSGFTSLGATTFKGFAVTDNADGRLEVVGVGNDGQLYTNQQTSVGGAFGGWIARGGVSISSRVAAARNADGRVEAFVVGGDGVVYHQWQTVAGGTTWSGYASIHQAGVFDSAVDVAAAPDELGQLTVAIVRSDGSVAVSSQSGPGGGFVTKVPLGGTGAQAGLALARTTDDRLEIFVTRVGATLWHRQQSIGADNTSWTPWQQFDPDTPFASFEVGEESGGSTAAFALQVGGAALYDERGDPAPLEYVGSLSLCRDGPAFDTSGKLRLDAKGIGTDPNPGNDSISFDGEIVLPFDFSVSTFQVETEGVYVRIMNALEDIILDLPLTGAYGGTGTRGWKRAGKSLVYIDRTGSPIAGVKKAKIKPSKLGFSAMRLSFKGTKSTYPIDASDAPLSVSISLGAIGYSRSRNWCGETVFPACTSNNAQTSLRCEQ